MRNEFEERAAKIRELLELQAPELLRQESTRRGVTLPDELLPDFIQVFCYLTQDSMNDTVRHLVKTYGLIRLFWPRESTPEMVRETLRQTMEAFKQKKEGR